MSQQAIEDRKTNRTTAIILAILAVLLAWYIVADRLTPYTSAARVKLYVVPVTPDVSGYVVDVPVEQNTVVEAGDAVLQIETARFEVAVARAEAELAAAGQDVGASTASVSSANAALVRARASLEEVRTQAARIFELERKGIYAAARGDQARAEVQTAEADVAAAQAELERSRQLLGPQGEDNPQVQLALTKLTEARLDLERSTYRAPMRAVVGHLDIDVGFYANAGQPVMALISGEELWLEANFTENNLAHINEGDRVEIAFDAFPGRIYEGVIRSAAVGVSTGQAENLGDLPMAESTSGWLRAAERYPVIVDITNYEYADDIRQGASLRLNGRANVIVYSDNRRFWNTLGAVWIRAVSASLYLY